MAASSAFAQSGAVTSQPSVNRVGSTWTAQSGERGESDEQGEPGQPRGTMGGSVNGRMGGSASGSVQSVPAMMMVAAPTITTGDANIDAKIKALQDERATKIKAINADYEAQIKALVGIRPITVTRPNGQASANGPMNDDNEDRPTMVSHDERMSDPSQDVPSSDPSSSQDNNPVGESSIPSGIKGFFYRIFNRGN